MKKKRKTSHDFHLMTHIHTDTNTHSRTNSRPPPCIIYSPKFFCFPLFFLIIQNESAPVIFAVSTDEGGGGDGGVALVQSRLLSCCRGFTAESNAVKALGARFASAVNIFTGARTRDAAAAAAGTSFSAFSRLGKKCSFLNVKRLNGNCPYYYL